MVYHYFLGPWKSVTIKEIKHKIQSSTSTKIIYLIHKIPVQFGKIISLESQSHVKYDHQMRKEHGIGCEHWHKSGKIVLRHFHIKRLNDEAHMRGI